MYQTYNNPYIPIIIHVIIHSVKAMFLCISKIYTEKLPALKDIKCPRDVARTEASQQGEALRVSVT